MLISICLHLGNVEFEDNDGEGCAITTPETLEMTAEMLQVRFYPHERSRSP